MRATAGLAKVRLLMDQAARPCAERRAALEIVSQRLEAAGRDALRRLVTARAAQDGRFAAVLNQLRGAGRA